jgi:hypothetical protein
MILRLITCILVAFGLTGALRASPVSDVAVPADILSQLRIELSKNPRLHGCIEAMGGSQEDIFSKNFRVQTIDTTKSGQPEIAVQGVGTCLCSPTGNCEFWVFTKTENGYRELLHTSKVQRFKIVKAESRRHEDIFTYMHGSAVESEVRVFRFDGIRYHLAECMQEKYMDSAGNDLKEPIITPAKCRGK